jgi:hypothetical protein
MIARRTEVSPRGIDGLDGSGVRQRTGMSGWVARVSGGHRGVWGQGLLAGTRFVLLGRLCLQGAPNVDSRDHGK